MEGGGHYYFTVKNIRKKFIYKKNNFCLPKFGVQK